MAEAVQTSADLDIDEMFKLPRDLVDAQGFNVAVFGYPGSGKTELGASAPKPLIVDVDGTGPRTLKNRTDVRILQPKTWDDILTVSDRLMTKPHPFETIVWDTVTSMFDKALTVSRNSGNRGYDLWNMPNDGINKFIDDWCMVARERGTNVVFNVHAKEEKDNEGNTNLIRMALTPNVLQTMYRAVDTIGYMEGKYSAIKKESTFSLLLRSNSKIIAKHHQPREGAGRIPLLIENPDLTKIISFSRTKE